MVDLRASGGAIALGRVLTLIIITDDDDAEDAIEAANDASREHPCRVLVSRSAATSAGRARLDAQIRVGGDAGASEVDRPAHVRRARRARVHEPAVPLLLPDAPVVAWWPGEPPARARRADPVGAMAPAAHHRRRPAPSPAAALTGSRPATPRATPTWPGRGSPVAHPARRRARPAAFRAGPLRRGERAPPTPRAPTAGRLAGPEPALSGERKRTKAGTGSSACGSSAPPARSSSRAVRPRWRRSPSRVSPSARSPYPASRPRVPRRGAAPPRPRRRLRRRAREGAAAVQAVGREASAADDKPSAGS